MKQNAKEPKQAEDEVSAKIAELKSKLKNYEALKKEYDLTEEHLNTRAVMRKMGETLESYIKILIQILQPEEFHSLHECTIFDDDDKEKIFDTYKSLMITHRELLLAEILNEEKNNISTINYANTELVKIKPEMMKFVTKMQSSWKTQEIKGKARYFG